jgi:hypothetical protein
MKKTKVPCGTGTYTGEEHDIEDNSLNHAAMNARWVEIAVIDLVVAYYVDTSCS